jgi:RND family efflux transporter MFP subunit
MKTWLKWILFVLMLALMGGAAWRVLANRSAQQATLQAQQAAQKTQAFVELTPSDRVVVQRLELLRTLPISGQLRAVNTAVVKARVAGELQGLTLREGDSVKAGQVIARVDATEYQARLRQAQQQAEAARTQVDIARRSFENNRSLVEQGFISRTALDTSQASLAGAEASFKAAQAGADVALKAIEDTVLRAPISGQVSQRLAQSGERVGVDARIVEIVDPSRLELEASLGASDSLDLKPGQTARLQVEGATQEIGARVVRINPSAASGSRAVLAYLALEPAKTLRQGLFAQGSLQLGKFTALAVPVNAVRTDKPKPYVQMVNQGLVVHQTVELDGRGEKNGQAMAGLRGVPDEAVVLAGSVGVLRPGTPVKQVGP